MSPIDSKRKGSDFEREIVKILPEIINNSEWKRIPTSGAIGTRMGVPVLFSDLVGKVDGFPKKFRAEAKVGYGGAKQFTLKKEWLDKIKEESMSTFSVPFIVGKFSGSRDGCRYFTVLDLETFAYLINYVTKLQGMLNEEPESLEKDEEDII